VTSKSIYDAMTEARTSNCFKAVHGQLAVLETHR